MSELQFVNLHTHSTYSTFFAYQPPCHFSGWHRVGGMIGVCSPPAGGELDKRMNHTLVMVIKTRRSTASAGSP